MPTKTYEITYLTVEEETADASKVKSIFADNKAKIVSVFPWSGRRKLTFPIKKQDQAFYTTVVFEAEPNTLQAIDRALQLDEAVLRSLVVEFVPGIFHRTPDAPRPAKEAAPEPEQVVEAQPVVEIETEEKPEVSVAKAKPKRAARKATPEETKNLDETLDALLKEDITK